MKTFVPKKGDIEKKWYLVDAEGKILGRLATEVANILRGKNKPIFSPHMDVGDFVIVLNAEKIILTGKKKDQKEYTYYTGYISGLKRIPFRRMQEKDPARVVRIAVRGMLPANKLRKRFMSKLKVYAGPKHPHEAQRPEPLELPAAAARGS